MLQALTFIHYDYGYISADETLLLNPRPPFTAVGFPRLTDSVYRDALINLKRETRNAVAFTSLSRATCSKAVGAISYVIFGTGHE
jgi:hypothetical protein